MFNNNKTNVSGILQNVLKKCKIAGSITADPGTGRQTILAYSRTTGELLGATTWNEISKTYEIFLQEQPDESIMLTRKDDNGILFSETYDRVSVGTETFVHGEEYALMQESSSIIDIQTTTNTLPNYPFILQHENLFRVTGTNKFNIENGELIVSGSHYSLPRKIRGCVYADNDIIIYDGNSEFFNTGSIHPAMNPDPFGDASMLGGYSLGANGLSCTGSNHISDSDLSKYVLGGYNLYEPDITKYTPSLCIPLVINRSATKTVVFSIQFYTASGYEYEILRIPDLLRLVVSGTSIYLYTLAGTTWTYSSLVLPSTTKSSQIAIVVSSSGFDKVYIDGQLWISKAVGVPTVVNSTHTYFTGIRSNVSALQQMIIRDVMVFNREITSNEIGSLYESINYNSVIPSASNITPIQESKSKIRLQGENFSDYLKCSIPLNSDSIGNTLGTYISNSVSMLGVTLLNEYVSFNGTTGYLYKSPFISWWDINDTLSYTIVTGVSELRDKGGRGNHLIQATTTAQPARVAAVMNGLAVMRFDGSTDFLTSAKLRTEKVSIFHVQQSVDTSYIVYHSGGSIPCLMIAQSSTSPGMTQSSHGQLRVDGIPLSSPNAGAVYTALNNKTAVVSLIGIDINAWADFRVNGYGSFFGAIDMGEILIIPGTASLELTQKIEGYLAHRHGTTAALQAAHPYKSVAPVGTLQQIIDPDNFFDTATSDLLITFTPSNVSTQQCIWKFGNAQEGIAIGIDATGHAIMYVRNSNVLTSSAFTATLSNGARYTFIRIGANISIYDVNNELIETKAHGLTIGTYSGSESLGAAFGGSPILGTTVTSGYFNGFVHELIITPSGTLVQGYVGLDTVLSVSIENTEVPCELVKWEDEVVLWASIPEINSEEDCILDFKITESPKLGITGSNAASRVWDNDFQAVYHMVPGSKLIDSTANKFDGDLIGIDNSNFIDHSTGYALNLNGTDEYARVKYPVLSDMQRASITTVFKADTIDTGDRLLDIALTDSQDSSQQVVLQFDASDNLNASFVDSDDTLIGSVSAGVIGTVDDNHITTYYNGKDEAAGIGVYVDGVLIDFDTPSGERISDSAGLMHIGKDAYASAYFDGSISELIISKKKRSEDFEKVMRLSMRDQLGDYVLSEATISTDTFRAVVPRAKVPSNLTDFPLCITFSSDTIPELTYPTEYSSVTCKATSTYTGYDPHFAVDPAVSVIGIGNLGFGWASVNGTYLNQKFNIDYGSPKLFRSIMIENGHSNGTSTNQGAKDFSVYGTNSVDAFNDTVYTNINDLTFLGTFRAKEHVASNISDPQYFNFDNSTPFRYMIIRIANNWGSFSDTGFRRVSFLDIPVEDDIRIQLFETITNINNAVFTIDSASVPAEIELWDTVNKRCTFHVKVPTLSSSVDTVIDLSMGDSVNTNIGITGSAAAANVWDTYFTSVLHLSSVIPVTDSKTLDITSVLNGTIDSTHVVPSIEGKGVLFNGTSDYIRNTSIALAAAAGTVDVVFMRHATGGTNYNIFHFGDFAVGSNQGMTFVLGSDNKFSTQYFSGFWAGYSWSTPYFSVSNKPYVASFSHNNAALQASLSMIIDGIATNQTVAMPVGYNGSNQGLYLGCVKGAGVEQFFSGIISELRVSNIVRSDAWKTVTGLCLSSKLSSYEYIPSTVAKEPIITHHWTMDNRDGITVNDEIGEIPFISSGMSVITGKFDNALSAGGVDTNTLIASVDVPFKSVSFWFKRVNVGKVTCILGTLDTSRVFAIDPSNSNYLYFYNQTGPFSRSTIACANTSWHHIVLVEGSNNNNHYMYYDGVKYETELTSNFGGVFRQIGRNSSAAQENCDIDNIQVYDTKLTDAEVSALYLAATQTVIIERELITDIIDYPIDDNTVLLIQSNTINGSTDFVDSSPNNLTLTPYLNVQHSTTQNIFGTSSIKFGGDGNRINIQNSAVLSLSGDFTIENLVYPMTGKSLSLVNYTTVNNLHALYFSSQSSARVIIGGVDVITGLVFPINRWSHYALVREGSSLSAYVNGVRQAQVIYNGTVGGSADNYIGGSTMASHSGDGYIAELRVSDTVRYTGTTCVPPARMYGEVTPLIPYPIDVNTLALIQSNTTDGSTTIIDTSPYANAYTAYGDAKHRTDVSKFGTSSIYFDGNGDYLKTNNQIVISIGTGDMSIDLWVYLNSYVTGDFTDLSANEGTIQIDSSGKFIFYNPYLGTGGNMYLVSPTIPLNEWTHLAVSRISGITYKFVNGILITQQADLQNYTTAARYITFGKYGGGASTYVHAHVEEIRISNNGRYLWNFNPPTLMYGEERTNSVVSESGITFTIPSGTVSERVENVPVMLRLSNSSGLNAEDVTPLLLDIKTQHLEYTGNRKDDFGIVKGGISSFNLPFTEFVRGPRYEYKGALRFDATNASGILDISNGLSRALIVGSLTAFIAIRPDVMPLSEVVIFGSPSEFQITMYTDGRIGVKHTSVAIYQTTAILFVNVWSTIIIVRDVTAKTIVIYQDGKNVYGPVAYTTQPTISATAITIGGSSTTRFQGSITDIKIFNKAFTESECYYLDKMIDPNSIYKENIVTALCKLDVPSLIGSPLNSVVVTDSVSGASVTEYTFKNGNPWMSQYDFNTHADSDITGWVLGSAIPFGFGQSGLCVTKNRLYLIGGRYYGIGTREISYAPISSDGEIGAFVLDTQLFPSNQCLFINPLLVKNKMYTFGGTDAYSGLSSDIYVSTIGEDGSMGTFSSYGNLPTATAYASFIYNNRVYVVQTVNLNVYSSPIGQDGAIGAFTLMGTIPYTCLNPLIISNRLYICNSNSVQYAIIAEDGTIGAFVNVTNSMDVSTRAAFFTSKNAIWRIGGTSLNCYHAPINIDGSLGTFVQGTSLPSLHDYGIVVITSSRLYLVAGGGSYNAGAIRYTSWTGGKNDYTSDLYTSYTPPFTLTNGVWYTVSQDGLTYYSFTDTWHPIASSNPSIHGVVGDNVPYYWDYDSQEWVYSKSSIEEAISNALAFPENRMSKDVLNGIIDFSSVYSSAVGTLNMGVSLYSDGTVNPEVIGIKINNKKYWLSEEYNLSDYCTTVASASIRYSYLKANPAIDYSSATKVYSRIDGENSWTECVNETIPNLTVGYATAGKKIRFKVEWDLSVWTSTVSEVSLEVTIK